MRFGVGILVVGALGWLDFDRPVAEVVARWQARASYEALRRIEPRAGLSGVTIFVPGGQMKVTDECTGVTITALVAAAVLAYPMPWGRRCLGVVSFVPLIFALDVIRVASLGVSLSYGGRAVFDVLHEVIWQGGIVLVVLGFWVGLTAR